MTVAFKDWQDTGNVTPLVLPIRDRDGVRREYVIPPLGYLDGIRLREDGERVREGGATASQLTGDEYLKLTLGGQLKQMRDDNVPASAITHAAAVAHADAIAGRDAAEQLWNEGPKGLAAALSAASSTTSPSTAAAGSSTKPRASTSGTRSRKTSSRSTGTRSSTSRG